MTNKDVSKPTQIPGGSIRSLLESAKTIRMTSDERVDSNVQASSSFFYDPPTLGLKSTQQLNVDWSKFENHTFFSSAEVNVNVAFDKVINSFPFDGTRKETEVFFEKLTGFEKYVYDSFPKNIGYLFFSGTQPGEDTAGTKGTFLAINDYAGGLFPELSKTKSGKNILDPGAGSFTIELQLLLASRSNAYQVVAQKLGSATQGFQLSILSSSSPNTAYAQLAVVSGTSWVSTSASLAKGQFNHIAFVYNKNSSKNKLQLYVNEELVQESITSVALGAMDIQSANFLIGSGTAITLGSTTSTPTQTLSGAIDEFRFFHSARTQAQIEKFARKSIFASDDLKLYFKFNEPTGTLGSSTSDTINRIVLDSSGNSLHSYISSNGFSFGLRSTGSISVPMTYEKMDLSPVLFPAFTDVIDLNSDLLTSASTYDQANPNIITKLVPRHYFLEGQASDGLGSEEGTLGDAYSGDSMPGSGLLGTTQLLLSLLYVWAKFFDELKLFIDSFSSLKFVDYNQNNTIPDHFLPLLMKQFGFHAPAFFIDASIEQFVDADNIQPVISTDSYSLQYIQNQILRRILSNINEIIKSKGTQHSVRAFLRTVGLDPDNSFRIREFGGPTKQQLLHARETKLEPALLLDFTGSGLVTSPYLSGSRVETGFPYPVGTMVKKDLFPPHGVSSTVSDGLFTSGSWTYEAAYRWPMTRPLSNITQSLVRLHTTGSAGQTLTFNLVAMTSSLSNDTSMVQLFARSTSGTTTARAPLMTLTLSGCNVFDGNIWNVSFGRTRGDSIGSSVSSSYFLRAATEQNGEIRQIWTTSSYASLLGTSPSNSGTLESTNSTINASGSFLVIGSSSLTVMSNFLMDTSLVPSTARVTDFNGQVARMRFWSKDLSEKEWKEHVLNYKSIGVVDPLTNFNFETVKTGSWQRLRLDATMDQVTRDSDSSGLITLMDFSQNGLHLRGTSFVTSSQVINSTLWSYSFISPTFDEATTNDKVRVRSYQNYDRVKEVPYAYVAPLYKIPASEEPTDDSRFSIEFSIMDALNRDIINIFSTLEALDNILGNPELIFSPDYPGIETLRGLYFNRLTDKINIRAFFEFYRWFDSSIGTFIEQLIPHKTKFYGTNFVVESHMLERPKFEYSFNDIYLGESDRHHLKDTLLVQQIVGTCKKY